MPDRVNFLRSFCQFGPISAISMLAKSLKQVGVEEIPKLPKKFHRTLVRAIAKEDPGYAMQVMDMLQESKETFAKHFCKEPVASILPSIAAKLASLYPVTLDNESSMQEENEHGVLQSQDRIAVAQDSNNDQEKDEENERVPHVSATLHMDVNEERKFIRRRAQVNGMVKFA